MLVGIGLCRDGGSCQCDLFGLRRPVCTAHVSTANVCLCAVPAEACAVDLQTSIPRDGNIFVMAVRVGRNTTIDAHANSRAKTKDFITRPYMQRLHVKM